MLRSLVLFIISSVLSTVYAQETPVGLWRTVDDSTKKPRSEVRIIETAGIVSGKVERGLDPNDKPDVKCDKCTDDRKDKEIIGMEIIRKVKKLENEMVWGGGGEILDPDNGKTYRVKLTPIEGGKKLQVRGYIGPFFRTQVWERVQ